MKRILILLLIAISCKITMSQHLAHIKIDSPQSLNSLFSLYKVHYYNHNFAIISTDNFNESIMCLIDKDAFANNKRYLLIYCPIEEQKSYLRTSACREHVLYQDEQIVILKSVEGIIMPYKSDGMVELQPSEARLGVMQEEFPNVTEENAMIRAMMDEIQADSLLSTIQSLQSFSSRRYDNDTVYMAQAWVESAFEDLGLEVYTQDFTFEAWGNIYETSDNVIAIQRGKRYPERYVICGAHYDSYSYVGKAPGADDNATGVAGVLETARILSDYDFDCSIMYCGWAAEERGLLGSEAFASKAEIDSLDIIAYFNLDMTGYLEEGLPSRIDLIHADFCQPLADFYKQLCKVYFPNQHVIRNWITNGDSDHSSFHRHGFMALFPFERVESRSPYIHTLADTLGLSVNNIEQSRLFTQMNLACVATLAGMIGGQQVNDDELQKVIYPIPANQYLNIAGKEISMIQVYNLNGQIVTSQHHNNDETIILNTEYWLPGVYLLRLSHNNGSYSTRKIIITH